LNEHETTKNKYVTNLSSNFVGSGNLVEKDLLLSPKIRIEPEIRSQKDSLDNLLLIESSSFLFNLKITDLSRLDNPYVIFENKRIDNDGYLMLDE